MKMEHDLKLSPDMDQHLAMFRDRWIRARALDAAVAFHAYRYVSDDNKGALTEVLDTSDKFVKYILIGRELKMEDDNA